MAQSVYLTYRISVNIEIPYHLIVSNTDSMKMLKDALEDDCLNKLEVVHDFFSVYKWNRDQVNIKLIKYSLAMCFNGFYAYDLKF